MVSGLSRVKRYGPNQPVLNQFIDPGFNRTSVLLTATPVIGSTKIVEQLELLIEEQSLRPGDRLPSIRDLADQFARFRG